MPLQGTDCLCTGDICRFEMVQSKLTVLSKFSLSVCFEHAYYIYSFKICKSVDLVFVLGLKLC